MNACPKFIFLFYLFHALVILAIFLVSFLFSTYQRSGQNVLLRSLCCVMIVALLLIESGYLFLGREPYDEEGYLDFAIIQAIVLNYCFISAQAHSACIMVNNCLLALGWRFGDWEKLFDRSLLFLLISYSLPIIPTLLVGTSIPDYAQHTMFPFFSFVPAPKMFTCCTIWLLICAIPGFIATAYLMFKTISLRRQTLEMTSYTQISRFQVFRLFTAMVIYIFFSLGSAIPLLLLDPDNWLQPENYLGSTGLKSPWKNFNLCCGPLPDDERLRYFVRVRCPGVMSFLPPLMGLGIFLMYGFGTPVRAALRKLKSLTNNAFCIPKRRMSTIESQFDTQSELSPEDEVRRLSGISEKSEEFELQADTSAQIIQRRKGDS